MPKLGEKGNVFLILVLVFFVAAGVAVFVVVKTLTNTTQKIAKDAKTLTVALKSEYENPFDKKTQYVNPFNEYKNPFDELK